MGNEPRMHVAKPRSIEELLAGESGIRQVREKSIDLPHETELINQICLSEWFVRSPSQQKLLRFLYKYRHLGLLAEDIDEACFGRTEESKHRKDGNHTRERISNLKKKRLIPFEKAHRLAPWRCVLPEAVGMSGYRLIIEPSPWTSSQKFWMQHSHRASDAIVITSSHLFFYDLDKKAIQRFSDFNDVVSAADDSGTDHRSEQTLTSKALKKKHPDSDVEGFTPTFNMYLAAGEVHASEKISRWFHNEMGILIERVTSREIGMKDLKGKAPIYIGRTQTNPHIRTALKSREASHLSYRILDSESQVCIKEITRTERDALKGHSISPDGYVSGLPGYVFGLVARFRNPTGQGHITVITCNFYSPAISGVVELLTNDKHADSVLKNVKWPSAPVLPDSFEMLFRLPMPRGSMEHESLPELLCGRLY